ncbi:hypothetical protein [Clostridium transplantifaecale]|uniref:hypothetical protein n=1 Tax=Clostridium transplantifaecale TaxID=2479838 RepID=UPI000F63F9C9|nr:hypothetical protein [Clostridium transplantifaecale]
MADYISDTKTVVQNLKDAGCSEEVVEEFIELAEAGEKQRQFKLLEKQRRTLLDNVHCREKQIDCLDYLVFQMKKTQEK